MAFDLTRKARLKTFETNVEPKLVLQIDGLSTLFGIGYITDYIRIGDPDLFIGDDWVIGGSRPIDDSVDAISFEGTTTSIAQQLLQDKGGASSVSAMQIALIDENEQITRLISPGFTLPEILGRKAWVYLGFGELNFSQDYIVLFSGVIDEITASGLIILNIAHPEQKKRQQLFAPAKTTLDGFLTNSATTIPVTSVEGFGLPSDAGTLKTYIRVDDELIEYTAVNTVTNEFTGCVRGQLGTAAQTHDDASSTESVYRLQGNAFDLALKLMLSNGNTYYRSGLALSSFVNVTPTTQVPNSIFWDSINITDRYGIVVGDKITVTGALNAANNVTAATVASIVQTDDGSYAILSGVSLVPESNSSATFSIQSKYAVLNVGLGMGGDEVDVEQYEELKNFFPSSLPVYDFRLNEAIEAKDFIDKELLFPAAAYTLPRKGRVSVGMTIPPLAIESLPVLDYTNVTKPQNVQVKRSTTARFYNTVLYQYAPDILEGKFRAGYIRVDEDSKNQIPAGSKIFAIKSKGMRDNAETTTIASTNSIRFLERYKFAAEQITASVLFGWGFNIEVGDVVIFGDERLQIPDTKEGNRQFQKRSFEVINKTMNIKSGEIQLTLVDTNYLLDGRYGIIGPASILGSGSTTTELIITDSYPGSVVAIEKDKWEPYLGQDVQIHNDDFSVVYQTTIQTFATGNPYKLLVSPTLPAPPPAGYILDMPNYGDSGSSIERRLWKNLNVFMNPKVDVTSGVSATSFNVGAGDIGKFLVGASVLVHTEDYSVASPEAKVLSVGATLVTVDTDLGFTPNNTHDVDLIGFVDGGEAYRYV